MNMKQSNKENNDNRKDTVELNENGHDGSGARVYLVFTDRMGENGRRIYATERFYTKAEALNWIKWAC